MPLAVEYAGADAAHGMDDRILGVITFGDNGNGGPRDPRALHVPLRQLHGSGAEVWRSLRPVSAAWEGNIGYAHNGDVLMAHLQVDEHAHGGIEAAAYHGYTQLRAFIEAQGYPFPVRLWNYFPGINEGTGDVERYKQFCVGRSQAIESAPDYEHRLPAASAIGSGREGLLIQALAARHVGVQVENPRQTSAFHYPRQYGPRSPSFSRAKLMHWDAGTQLFLSGTASVVGHETLHENDCKAQFRETLRNIETLLESASAASAAEAPRFDWRALDILRVYLRDAANADWVRTELVARLGADAPLLILAGDICRSDLLVEIEGIFSVQD